MKYFYFTKNESTIAVLGTGKKVPKKTGYHEITKVQYDSYMATLNSIEQREGYEAHITLYIDGTYEVEYVPIENVGE